MSAYKEYAYAPLKHWSDKINGRDCNGCRCMEVLPRKRKWHSYEEYFCSWRHMVFQKPDDLPTEGRCGHRIDAKSLEGNS